MYKYRSSIDRTSATIVTANGRVLIDYVGACYGSIFCQRMCNALSNEDAMYMDVYYNDSITEFYKGDTTITTKFIQTLQETGLYVNTEVTLVPKKEVPPMNDDVISFSPYVIKIRHHIDKASAPEMFLIGNCIRTVAIYPEVVCDYVQLLELEPTIDKWQLWIITQAMTLNPKREMMNGHKLGTNYFNLVSDYSLEDFYKRSECEIPLRKATRYQLHNSEHYDDLFVNDKVPLIGEGIGATHYGTTRPATGASPRRQGVIYSKEALETFFDVDKLMASLCTPAYSINPYVKYEEPKKEPKPVTNCTPAYSINPYVKYEEPKKEPKPVTNYGMDYARPF
jgi:hypothetical protein